MSREPHHREPEWVHRNRLDELERRQAETFRVSARKPRPHDVDELIRAAREWAHGLMSVKRPTVRHRSIADLLRRLADSLENGT